jgi:hypothetical protein
MPIRRKETALDYAFAVCALDEMDPVRGCLGEVSIIVRPAEARDAEALAAIYGLRIPGI